MSNGLFRLSRSKHPLSRRLPSRELASWGTNSGFDPRWSCLFPRESSALRPPTRQAPVSQIDSESRSSSTGSGQFDVPSSRNANANSLSVGIEGAECVGRSSGRVYPSIVRPRPLHEARWQPCLQVHQQFHKRADCQSLKQDNALGVGKPPHHGKQQWSILLQPELAKHVRTNGQFVRNARTTIGESCQRSQQKGAPTRPCFPALRTLCSPSQR